MKKGVITLVFIVFIVGISNAQIQPITEFYKAVNSIREDMNMMPLTVDNSLERLALLYSTVCSQQGDISHGYMTDDEVFYAANQYGASNYTQIGEVLQMGKIATMNDMEYITEQFMRSPNHRRILLKREGDTLGASYVELDGKVYLTAYVGRY